jgi:hypothetical protein
MQNAPKNGQSSRPKSERSTAFFMARPQRSNVLADRPQNSTGETNIAV